MSDPKNPQKPAPARTRNKLKSHFHNLCMNVIMAPTALQLRQRARFRRCVDLIDASNSNFVKLKCTDVECSWSGTVTIKLDVGYGHHFKQVFGVDFMNEQTLWFTDDDNNCFFVYNDPKKVVPADLTSNLHVLDTLSLTTSCFVHKEMDPVHLPEYIKVNLNFQNSTIIVDNSVINNIQNLNLSSTLPSSPSDLEAYCAFFFSNQQMMSIKQLTQHPLYYKSFRDKLIIKNVNLCFSCHKRYLKGCCTLYGNNKKTTRKMILGFKV